MSDAEPWRYAACRHSQLLNLSSIPAQREKEPCNVTDGAITAYKCCLGNEVARLMEAITLDLPWRRMLGAGVDYVAERDVLDCSDGLAAAGCAHQTTQAAL